MKIIESGLLHENEGQLTEKQMEDLKGGAEFKTQSATSSKTYNPSPFVPVYKPVISDWCVIQVCAFNE